jgi:hypothetical protein
MRILHTVLLAGSIVLAVQTPARAVTFTATLGSIKITARPGQVMTREFRLTLDADQHKTRFTSHMQDWWRSEDGATSYYKDPGTLVHSCGRWVTLNPVETEVPPGGTLITRLSVAVPPGTAAGGYWCVLTVDELADPLAIQEGVGVRFLASVSVGVFVNVGEIQRAVEITGVDVRDDEAIVKLRNDGNAPAAIEGRFEFLKPGATEPTAVVTLPRGTLLTEPFLTGLFSVKLPAPTLLPAGRYMVRAIIDYGVDHYIGTQRELDITRTPTVLARVR